MIGGEGVIGSVQGGGEGDLRGGRGGGGGGGRGGVVSTIRRGRKKALASLDCSPPQ